MSMELTAHQLKKKVKGLCVHPYCLKNRQKQKSVCSKHKRERNKQINPISITYSSLKTNAKRRNIAFTLTIEHFRQWCESNDYIKLKGRFKGCMTIDRIDPSLGYADGNIQMMRNADNLRKRWVDYYAQQNEVPEDYCTSYNPTTAIVIMLPKDEPLPF